MFSALDSNGNILVVDISTGIQALFRIDPVTGDRVILSSASIGSGPNFVTPFAVLEQDSGAILVLDNGIPALLSVDPTTGNRTVLSSASVGSGTAFSAPRDANFGCPLDCTTYFLDSDQDGYGVASDSRCLCEPTGLYTATVTGDCDDSNASVNPGATELWNGIDDDCDAVVDGVGSGDCTTYFRDDDGDGYGVSADSQCLGAPAAPYSALLDGDCNDSNADVNPGMAEACNGIDDDCDASIDEDFDLDRDGYTTCQGDCDDTNSDVNPDAAEQCNGIDDDCDAVIDGPGSSGCTTYFRDDDADGYGVSGDSQCLCAPEAPYTATVIGDCDDGDAGVNPAATETCNGIDDDCDGDVDGGFDADMDGFTSCGGDCDDNDASVNPAAVETCNGIDDNCEGTTDEGFDLDLDGWTSCGGDCDDGDPLVNPMAVEECNSIDDNCDAVIDEGCNLFPEFCHGDGGDQMGCSDCPCANESLPGTLGGCLNSAGTSTRLLGQGTDSVLAADLRFEAIAAPPSVTAVLTSGGSLAPANPMNPCTGMNSGIQAMQLDGLRCAIQGVLRHGVRVSNLTGEIGATTPGWGLPDGFFGFGAFTVGATRHFQIIHRDDEMAVCMRGQNTSQAVSVTFGP